MQLDNGYCEILCKNPVSLDSYLGVGIFSDDAHVFLNHHVGVVTFIGERSDSGVGAALRKC